jgi:hypothetical protein
MNFLRPARIALLVLLLAATLRAEEIAPPFGLRWGETAERMDRLLRGAKATVVDRRFVDGKEAWDVEGLLQQGLKRTVFYFHRSELVEVELQYQQEGWDDTRYDSFMTDVRKKIETKFGEGQLVCRRTEPASEPSVTQKLVGYKWNHNNTAIELIYFAASNPSQAWRTLSVHYKTY